MIVGILSIATCALAFKKDTALGGDQWEPAAVKKLPVEGKNALINVYNKIEETLMWPIQVLINIIRFDSIAVGILIHILITRI